MIVVYNFSILTPIVGRTPYMANYFRDGIQYLIYKNKKVTMNTPIDTNTPLFQLEFDNKTFEHTIAIDDQNADDMNFIKSIARDIRVKNAEWNPNPVNPKFLLVNKSINLVSSVKVNQKKMEAFSKVTSMSIESLIQLCYRLNVPLKDTTGRPRSSEELIFDLTDMQKGVIYKEATLGGKVVNNYDIVLAFEGSVDDDIRVNINKAIQNGFLKKENGRRWNWDGIDLGMEEEDIYSYFKDNPKSFEAFAETLKAFDFVPPSLSNVPSIENANHAAQDGLTLTELKAKAKALGIMHTSTMGEAKLREKIAEKEEQIAKTSSGRVN